MPDEPPRAPPSCDGNIFDHGNRVMDREPVAMVINEDCRLYSRKISRTELLIGGMIVRNLASLLDSEQNCNMITWIETVTRGEGT